MHCLFNGQCAILGKSKQISIDSAITIEIYFDLTRLQPFLCLQPLTTSVSETWSHNVIIFLNALTVCVPWNYFWDARNIACNQWKSNVLKVSNEWKPVLVSMQLLLATSCFHSTVDQWEIRISKIESLPAFVLSSNYKGFFL